MRHRPPLWLLLCAMCCVLAAATSFADVPRLIRYQGQAVDSQGVPLEGPYSLTFRLYDAETAGTKLWEEQQVGVVLTGGHFSVLLGQVTLLDTVDWAAPRWLAVQVNSEPELAPRQRITSVPLALRAKQAEALTQPITPALITPQGTGSGLDADTVDGAHAVDLRARATHTGTQAPATISPQGSGSGFDADALDGKDSSQFASNPHTHQCSYRMGIPTGQTPASVCVQNGEWCVTGLGAGGRDPIPCTNTNPGFGDWGCVCCK